jgi:hypothetical protein
MHGNACTRHIRRPEDIRPDGRCVHCRREAGRRYSRSCVEARRKVRRFEALINELAGTAA